MGLPAQIIHWVFVIVVYFGQRYEQESPLFFTVRSIEEAVKLFILYFCLTEENIHFNDMEAFKQNINGHKHHFPGSNLCIMKQLTEVLRLSSDLNNTAC